MPMDKVVQHFRRGEVIIPEGSQGDRVYKVLEGEVLICKKNPKGKLIPVAKLGSGEIFGEMYLFEASGARSASVVAANDVKVEVFFEEDLKADLAKAPAEMQQILQGFSHRLRHTTGSFVNQFKEKVIVELPDGTMRVSDQSSSSSHA